MCFSNMKETKFLHLDQYKNSYNLENDFFKASKHKNKKKFHYRLRRLFISSQIMLQSLLALS